jgi:DNA-binding IclR family transcriptional regulator
MALKTLENALEILKYFTKETPAWGVRELAKEMAVSHSIIHRILTTYVKYGFLVQNQETKKYELGIKFWEYGLLVQDRLHMSDFVHPVMQTLCEETGETAIFTLLDGIEAVDVEIVESPQKVKYLLTPGTRAPLYVGASSKVLMAFLPAEKQQAVIQSGLESFTGKTIVDPQTLLADLADIKNKGWCFSEGEYFEDTFGLSVPLFDKKGKVVASLSIAGPSYRMTAEKIPEALAMLQNSARSIQEYLQKFDFNLLRQKSPTS